MVLTLYVDNMKGSSLTTSVEDVFHDKADVGNSTVTTIDPVKTAEKLMSDNMAIQTKLLVDLASRIEKMEVNSNGNGKTNT